MKHTTKGIYAINLTALLLGGTTLFPKVISLSASSITFGRSVVAGLGLLLFLIAAKEPIKITSGKDSIIIPGLGILLTLHWVSLFYAIQVSTVAVAVISLYTYPVITVFLEPLFSGERLKFRDVLTAAIVFAGIIMIVPKFDISNDISKGVAAGIFSAITFALRHILHRKYTSHYPGSTIMFYQIIVVVIALLPFIDIKNSIPNQTDLILLIVLGIFFTALPHSLFAYSLRFIKAKTVGIIASMQPLYATVFGIIILGEIPLFNTIIGGLLIVGCAMYESFKTSSEKVSGDVQIVHQSAQQ